MLCTVLVVGQQTESDCSDDIVVDGGMRMTDPDLFNMAAI